MKTVYSFNMLVKFLQPFRDAYLRSGAVVGEAYAHGGTTSNELERGILYVAFQMAALDGAITGEELRLVRDFAMPRSDASPEEGRKERDFAVRRAAYLAMIATLDDYTEDMRLAAFMEAVNEGLPKKFAGLDRECLGYAFTFWTAMAMADGEFSPIEHRALEMLKAKFDQERAVGEPSLQDEDFVGKAEELLRAQICPLARQP